MSEFRYKCTVCGTEHVGLPAFGAPAPELYNIIPEEEREERCVLGTDNCIVDNEHFFIRALLEIPIEGSDERFVWIVWVSQSRENYDRFVATFQDSKRSHLSPAFGWFSSKLPGYPDTLHLKTMAHFQDNLERPQIELEETDHPLSIDQRNGISLQRLSELVHICMNGQ